MNDKVEEFGWWIEILTNNPNYLYYFGPFNSYWEAEWSKNGYIQDLEEEKAIIVNNEITQCQPKRLNMPIVPFGYYSIASHCLYCLAFKLYLLPKSLAYCAPTERRHKRSLRRRSCNCFRNFA